MSSNVGEMTRVVTVPPDEWHQITLGHIITLEYGRSLPDKVRRAGDVAVYGSNGVVGAHDEALVPTGGIIVGRKGTAGSVTVSLGPFWPIDTTYFVKARQTVNWDWLAATLHHARLNELNEATGVPGLNRDKAYRQPVLLPPLDEQRRIAEVLRSVDEAIASADLALTQARMVRHSAINELLSPTGGSAGLDRLSCRLVEVLSIAHGFAFKSEYFTSNRDDPILLTPGNFSVEKTLYFGERTKHYSGPVPDGYLLADGSLVVVMTDLTQDMAILGNAVEVSGNGVVLHNQRIGRVSLLRSDLITKGYARLLLNSDHVQSRIKATASGSTVRHTAPSRILECEVQLPPLDEQARIVAIAKSLDDIVIAEERRRSDDEVTGPLSHLRGLKDMIARDLLSGRVRVPA